MISSVTTSGVLRAEMEVWPRERLSFPLNLSSLLELWIPQISGKNLPMALGKDSQDSILSESESPSVAKIMRNKNYNDLILKAVSILAHIFLSARLTPR